MNRFQIREYTLTFIVDGNRTVKIPVRAGSRGEAKVLATDSLCASDPRRRVRYVTKRGNR